jgi:hypothetical protein
MAIVITKKNALKVHAAKNRCIRGTLSVEKLQQVVANCQEKFLSSAKSSHLQELEALFISL